MYTTKNDTRVSYSAFIHGRTDCNCRCIKLESFALDRKYFNYAYAQEHVEIHIEVTGSYVDEDSTVVFNGVSEVLSKGTTFNSIEGRLFPGTSLTRLSWRSSNSSTPAFHGQQGRQHQQRHGIWNWTRNTN